MTRTPVLAGRPVLRAALAATAGIALTAAFAPLSLWPLAILCPAALMLLWQDAPPKEAALLGFLFNAGTFSAGTWWIYLGLHGHGGAPAWLALALVGALTGVMAIYHAVLGYCTARWLPAKGVLRWLVALPAAWLLIEWWRGWFLSGFSWLSLGYSQTDTWLKGLAPLTGVYGISAVLLLMAGALVVLLRGTRREQIVAFCVLVIPWPVTAALSQIDWTHPTGKPVSVAILQGAVPQDEKWEDSHRDQILNLYAGLTRQALGSRIIVLPEASLPDVAGELSDYIDALDREAQEHGSNLVLGVLRNDDADRYFNSVLALTEEESWYDKHHLVPFAEYFPIPAFVRQWMRLINLPYDDFTPGPFVQPPLPAGGLKLSASVCYEDAYGSQIIANLDNADALVNVTNDAWFGHSGARHQHLQIARMRSIETGRDMIRAANDGISVLIGPHGEIRAQAPGFKATVLRAEVTPRAGTTPYVRAGNWPIVILALAALAGALIGNRRRKT